MLLKSDLYGSCEQCTGALFTQKSQQSLLKKKKKKRRKAQKQNTISSGSKRHLSVTFKFELITTNRL